MTEQGMPGAARTFSGVVGARCAKPARPPAASSSWTLPMARTPKKPAIPAVKDIHRIRLISEETSPSVDAPA